MTTDNAAESVPTDDRLPSRAGAGSRRLLLGGALGLVLPMSGLVLPDASEARGRSHGRNRGHRPGKHKERRKGNRNDQNHAPGLGPLDVSFTVHNDFPVTQPNGSTPVKAWAYSDEDLSWNDRGLYPLANGASFLSRPWRSNLAGIVINDRVFIGVRNLAVWWPQVWISHGGTMTTNGYSGGSDILEPKGLSVNEQVEATGEGYHFTLKRLEDTSCHCGNSEGEKVFEFRFRPA